MILDLRKDYQQRYREAMRDGTATLTAAPFYSFKTETIRLAIGHDKSALIHDMREGTFISPLKGTKNIFLDSIEIIPRAEIATTLRSLQEKGICAHLITHLYNFEEAMGLLPQARCFFPQLLDRSDLISLKRIFKGLAENERALAQGFVDYSEGWPGIARLLDSNQKRDLFIRGIQAFLKQRNREPAEHFYRGLSRKVFKFYFDTLRSKNAISSELINKNIRIAAALWKSYTSEKTGLRGLADSCNPILWPYLSFGYLWLDEAKGIFRVPKMIAENS